MMCQGLASTEIPLVRVGKWKLRNINKEYGNP